MRYTLMLLAALLAADAVQAETVPSRVFTVEGHGRRGDGYFPDDDPRRITAVHDVETPHIAWEGRFAGGPLRVLAISHKIDGRWPVELAQRFDMEVVTIYGHAPESLGAYPERGKFVQSFVDVEARLLQAMNEPIDVVISNMAPGALGENVLGRIRELMAQGTGYVGPVAGTELEEWALQQRASENLVKKAVPFGGMRRWKSEFATAEEMAEQAVRLRVGPAGQRAADLSALPRDDAAPDPDRLQYPWLPSMEEEAWCSLTAQALLWAAGRISGDEDPVGRTPGRLERSQLPFAEAREGVTTRIWDEDGRLRHTGAGISAPVLPAGRYFAGIHAMNASELVDWTLDTFEVSATPQIEEIALETTRLERGTPVQATVTVSGEVQDGMRVQFKVWDNWGRCLYRDEAAAAGDAIRFTGDAGESLHLYNYAEARLLDSVGEVVSEKRRAFYQTYPRPATDDLSLMIWEACASFAPSMRPVLRRFAALGAESALVGAYRGDTETGALEVCAMSNIHTVLYVTRLNAVETDAQGVRQPCITAPGYLDNLKRTLQRQAEVYRQFSPLAYSLGDDQQYVRPGQDLCWSPSCREQFSAWARERYGSIEELNTAWSTAYADFADIEPARRAEALAAAQAEEPDFGPLCHWVEHQLFLDTMLADWHRDVADTVEEVDTGAVAWYDCAVEGWLRPGSAFDFWQLGSKSQFSVQYPNPAVHDIFQSALQRDSYHGTWYGGYGLYNYYPFNDADYLPWWSVFRGLNLHGLYYGGNSPSYFEERLLTPDLGMVVTFERKMKNIEELRAGTAKLLFAAEKLCDGIAFVYSPSSVHLSVLYGDGLAKAPEWAGQTTDSPDFVYMHSWEGMAALFRDLGFGYRVIPETALDSGAFLEQGYKALVMPMQLRITQRQQEHIEGFVRGGGVLITDALLGVFSGDARPRAGGELQDVLGARRRVGARPQDDIRYQPVRDAEGKALARMAVDSGLEPDGARPAATADDGAPALLVHRYGQGRAICLNMLGRDYHIHRALAAEMPLRDAVGALLTDEAGLRPAVACEVSIRGKDAPRHRIQATEINRYALGDAEYVGFLRHHKMRPDDSVFMADQRPKPAHITFDRPAHVYDVRNRMYRGYVSGVEDVLYPGRAELYALLPYEVRDIRLEGEGTQGAVVVRGGIETGESGASATTHVFHFDVDGQPELRRNVVAEGGRFEERFFVGLETEPRPRRVVVRDVASGLEREIFVTPR